jgi:hypothetical protein
MIADARKQDLQNMLMQTVELSDFQGKFCFIPLLPEW